MITQLLSEDELTRSEAIKALNEKVEQDPSSVVSHLEELIKSLPLMDHYTAFQVSSCVSTICNTMPMQVNTNLDAFREALHKIAQKLDEAEFWETVALNIFSIVNPALTNPVEVEKWLSTLFLLSNSNKQIKYSASAPIITIAMQSPQVLKNHVRDIFGALRSGHTILATSLMNLYNYDKGAFIENTDFLVKLAQTDQTMQTVVLNLLLNITKDEPNAINQEHVNQLSAMLHNPTLASTLLMVFEPIAEHSPEYLLPHVDTICTITNYNQNVLFQVPNILGLIARNIPDLAPRIVEELDKMLAISSGHAVGMILAEFRNIAEMDKELVQPYFEKIRSYEESPQEYIRDQAKLFVDYMEGKDIRSLSSKIEEQNAKIQQAATSLDDLMIYIDNNISLLKEFIADIAKKLPMPRRFSTEGRIRKTLILHFVCDKENERCLFPEDRPFNTETKSWSKWLKVAFSGVKLGKALIIPAAFGDAAKAVKEAYDAYKSEGDEEFLTYISQPFLTSSEQDNLIEQLREAKFFDVFSYDAQIAGWVCTMCNLS